MRHARLIAGSSVFSLVCVASLLGGCSAAEEQRAGIVTNPTPELVTLQSRESDVTNTTTAVFDTNLRAARNDIGKLFLTDRPSRLVPEPVR